MSIRSRLFRTDGSAVLGASALLFIVVFGGLRAIQTWNLLPSVAMQSATVRGGTVLLLVGISWYAYRGWPLFACWIFAFGPSFGFVLNLFVTLPGGLNTVIVAFVLLGGFVTSGLLAIAGYAVGTLGRKIEASRSSEMEH